MATSAEWVVPPQIVPELEPKIKPILEPIVAASAPTVPSHPSPLPLNWDDVDPISLEPVCTVWPYFEMEQVGKQADSQELSQGFQQVDEQGDKQAAAESRSEPACGKNKEPRVRRYDAWAWLEMLRRDKTGRYKHPVTGERIGVKDRAACVQACREAHGIMTLKHTATQRVGCTETFRAQFADEPRGAKLLFDGSAPCLPPSVCRADDFDPVTGQLLGAYFYCADPSYDVVVTDSWCEWTADAHTPRPEWARCVRSAVAVKFAVFDHNGTVVARPATWFGDTQGTSPRTHLDQGFGGI